LDAFKSLLSRKSRFLPKTQAQALMALSEGIIHESFYMYKAVNVHPVFEEPWDLDEIERLLAKPDLDVETTILLMTIFQRLIKQEDKELALFAAESINAVEQRRMRKIQGLKKRLDESKQAKEAGRDEAGNDKADNDNKPSQAPSIARDLAREYRDLGRVCFAQPVLKVFYIEEALSILRKQESTRAPDDRDLELQVELLLELGRNDEACMLVSVLAGEYPENAAYRFLAAKTAYARREFRNIVDNLDEHEELQSFWMGKALNG